MKDHLILIGWFAVTAVVNYLMRTKTAEEWEKLAERSPRYAAIARMLRAIGLDPVKLLQSLVDFVRGESQKRLGLPAEARSDEAQKAPEPPPSEDKPAEEESQKEGKDIA